MAINAAAVAFCSTFLFLLTTFLTTTVTAQSSSTVSSESSNSDLRNTTNNSLSHEQHQQQEMESDSGTLAFIVMGVLGTVVLIGAVVGFIVYKQYVRRNVKSMNFDNPVYRKTTEDQFALEKNQYQPARSYPAVREETLEPLNHPGTNEFV